MAYNRLFASVITALLLGQVSYAQNAEPVFFFSEVSGPGRQYPAYDIMSDGTMILSFTEREDPGMRIMVCISTDNGASWSSPQKVTNVNSATLGLQRRPRFLKTSDGTFHAIFQDYRLQMKSNAFHCYSKDGGVSWSSPTVVGKGAESGMQDFVSAAVDSSGQILVSMLSAGVDAFDALKHVYLVKSSDNGTSWSNLIRVDRFEDGGACECCQQSIDIGPSGEIAIGFRSNINNRRDIYVALSFNDGASFDPPVLIQDQPWTIDGCPSQGPSLKFDLKRRLHLAWVDGRDAAEGRPIVYYAILTPGQTTTPANVDLSSALSETAEYPSLDVFGDGGKVLVAWESSKGVYSAFSRDGQMFSSSLLDPITVHNANVSAAWRTDGVSSVVWQANRDGYFDVRVHEDYPTSVHEIGEPVALAWLSEDGFVRMSTTSTQESRILICDITGQIVAVLNQSDVNFGFQLPARGFYLLTITAGSDARRQVVIW